MGENNVWSDMLSKANGQYTFFPKDLEISRWLKRIIASRLHLLTCTCSKNIPQNTTQGYRNIALVILLNQATLIFVFLGRGWVLISWRCL